MVEEKRKRKKKGRAVHQLFSGSGVLIPGPRCEVNMTLPEEHIFVIFMKGEPPFVLDAVEPGDWTFSGENIADDAPWPAVAMALPQKFVENYLHLIDDEKINDIIEQVQVSHRKTLN